MHKNPPRCCCFFSNPNNMIDRKNYEYSLGFVLHSVHLDLCCSRHYLHPAGRSLLCGLHRYYTACPHIRQFGKFVILLVFIVSSFVLRRHSNTRHKNSPKVVLCDIHLDFNLSLQWVCVPFVLMSPYTLDINQTLMNNTLHAPWIGILEMEKAWIVIDDFLFFVRKQQQGQHQMQFT